MIQGGSQRAWSNGSEAAISLPELRRRLGRSQAEVAVAMGTTQSGVSRLERQPDVRLSTLHDYVTALGARLHLVVEHDVGYMEVELSSTGPHTRDRQQREYRVIWQDQASRRLLQVGWLQYTGTEFVFSYTQDAKSNPSFRPFTAFPMLDETYRSTELFPFFALRLISTADPQFDALLDALGLSRDQATPAELLARSPSDSPHDTIQVVPEPTEEADGTLARTFLVSGVRHAYEEDPDGCSQALVGLEPGSPLELVPEPTNPTNPLALKLASRARGVGWVPDYLVEEIHSYRDANRAMSFVVERTNGPESPWHLRLLCRLTVAPR